MARAYSQYLRLTLDMLAVNVTINDSNTNLDSNSNNYHSPDGRIDVTDYSSATAEKIDQTDVNRTRFLLAEP